MIQIVLGLAFVLSSFVFREAAATQRPEFEVVDIKLSKSGVRGLGSGRIIPSGQFQGVNIPLKAIIQFAYGVRTEAITGAPGWVDVDRYDIVGKGPAIGTEKTFWPNTPLLAITGDPSANLPYVDETFRLMVQSMLADRFKLVVRQEQRPTDVYALVIAKGGSKLQKAADAGMPDCVKTNDGTPRNIYADCKHMTMPDLARMLPSFAPAYVDREVLDFTSIKGAYDFKLGWTGKGYAEDVGGGVTLPEALEKQIGLKLEDRKVPMPIIVIEHIERPSEN
jgi:bla regulator protein BlaR1